jgi:hypothetical protein
LIPVDFTSKVEEFVAHNGPKLSYTKASLGNEFFIKSNDLLFEQGVNDTDLNIQQWEGVPCFFSTNVKSTIPFDIFAASFYLISRYEEYLPHVKDVHGRFTAEQSMAFKHGFLEKPVVDIWACKFLGILKEKFPDYNYKTREYNYISTIDIDNAFAYKHKNLVRSIGGFFNDKIHKLFLYNKIHKIDSALAGRDAAGSVSRCTVERSSKSAVNGLGDGAQWCGLCAAGSPVGRDQRAAECNGAPFESSAKTALMTCFF